MKEVIRERALILILSVALVLVGLSSVLNIPARENSFSDTDSSNTEEPSLLAGIPIRITQFEDGVWYSAVYMGKESGKVGEKTVLRLIFLSHLVTKKEFMQFDYAVKGPFYINTSFYSYPSKDTYFEVYLDPDNKIQACPRLGLNELECSKLLVE